MGFGPFLSKEEKARINASMKRNGNGLIQGVGERITPEENERRRRAASPEGMGLTQKDLGVGFGPFVSPAQKIQINNNLRQSQGGAYGPGGSPDGSGRGQAQQGVRPIPKAEIPKAASRPYVRGSERGDSGSIPEGMFTGPFQRYRSDGKGGETPVNVVRQGQHATLGGKRVVADGEGGWRDNTGSLVGEYRPGEDRTAVRKPMADLRGSQAPGSMTPAAATAFTPKTPETKTPETKTPETTTEEASVVPERPSQATGGQETSALTGGRGDTRTNGNGVIQTGTNTSPKPMTMDDASKLLSGGYKIEDPYSSNQLPYTQSSPYAGKGNSQIYNQETLQQFDGDVDNVKLATDLFGGKSGVEKATPGFQMSSDFNPMDAYGKGQMPDNYDVVSPLGKAGEPAESGPTNWANRSMADNSDEKVRRRSAMLDGNVGIMQAMRNQEAIQGRVYAGGKHYQVNKNKGQEGENNFVEISASQARDRSWGNQTADEVFANHLGKAKEKTSGADLQTASQDAPAMLPDAVPGNTPMDQSPFDTEELMQQKPSKSIIGNNSPYTSVKPGTLFR